MVQDKPLYLIDGSGFIFRAYHALPPLTRPDGTPVGAVYGFCNMILRVLEEAGDAYIAVIFDTSSDTFRKEIYPEYKANRPEPPEDLVPQFGLIRDAVRAFSLPSIELDGYEADDLIAAYAKAAKAEDVPVKIISSDKDLMQLMEDGVEMIDPIKMEPIGVEKLKKKFAITDPKLVVDVQSLSGDSTDNVPGVPGIGPKTAAKLLEEFGDLEGILANAESIPQTKRRENLIEYAEQARISKKLVQLDDTAPLPLPLKKLDDFRYDHDRLIEFVTECDFNTLRRRIERIFGSEGAEHYGEALERAEEENTPEAVEDRDYHTITDLKTLRQWCSEAKETGIVAIDTETNSLTPAGAMLVGVSMSSKAGRGAYIPFAHKPAPAQGSLLDDIPSDKGGDIEQLDTRAALEVMRELLEDPEVIKVGQNIKFDLQMFAKFGVQVSPVEDTMVISYVLDGAQRSHGMDALSKDYLGIEPIPYKELVGTGKNQKTLDQLPVDDVAEYAAEDADITLQLYHVLKERLDNSEFAQTVYREIDLPLVTILAEMELNGITVDLDTLNELSKEFNRKSDKLADKIFQEAGEEFNIASPKQVGEILFDSMGIDGGKKTKSGTWSTSADVLEGIAAMGHQIAQDILDWRGLTKLVSTYTDALAKQIVPDTGRVHTSFTQTVTSTGRLSSTDPNLQNIPIRTEEGRRIRTAFVPPEGYTLVAVDYSQVELRLVAHMAGIEKLKQAFRDGIDIHSLTASEVFGGSVDSVDPDDRRKAKAINFGIIYGISGYGLGRQLGINPGEAQKYIDLYFDRFPELRDFMEETKAFARKTGYVETVFGRRCYIPEIKSSNYNRRSAGERQAINAPVQGTAADIMKKAMIAVHQKLHQSDLDAKMLLQVHDELVFEVKSEQTEALKTLVKETMEAAYELDLPLIADTGTGSNWDEAH